MNWPWQRKQPATAPTAQVAPYGAATSARSWEYVFKSTLGSYVPLTVDYSVYDAIREGVPFVDTALRKLARMAGGFKVKSPSQATADRVNEWLYSVRTFGVCSGFDTFERSYVNSLLQYGKSLGEIVLSENGRDIYELTIVPTKRVRLIQTPEGLQFGEDSIAGIKPYERQDLFGYSAMNVMGDNPHGTSILRSLPFVANIQLVMQNALRQRWMRHGAPSFVFFEELDPTLTIPPEDIVARKAAWRDEWNAAMTDRWEQQGVRDFFGLTQGKMRVDTAEPRLNPDYVEPWRSLAEQVVGNTELAPFMLGLQWSTTERLSQQQADMIISLVASIREEVGPAYLHMVDWFQRLNGVRGVVEADWEDVSLQDAVESAQAENLRAQAMEKRVAASQDAWRAGYITQDQAAVLAEVGVDAAATKMEAPPAKQGAGNIPAAMSAGGNGRGAVAAADLWDGYPARRGR